LYQGEWSAVPNYLRGDIVKESGNYYVAVTNNTNSIPPSIDWVAINTALDTSVWVSGTYTTFLSKPAFTGANSYLKGGAGIGSTNAIVPTRYAEYLADGGIPTDNWLGANGTVIPITIGSTTYNAIIKDGTLSHYTGVGYETHYRGQRMWAKYTAGDTYEIKVMGAGDATGWAASYWVLNTTEPGSIATVYEPSVETTITTEKYITTVESVTFDTTTTYSTTAKTLFSNQIATLTAVTATNYRLTNLYDKYRFAVGVEYVIDGCVYVVTSINHGNKTVDLTLLEGFPILGPIDVSQFIQFRIPFTLAFNEALGAFTSFYDFTPTLYIKGFRNFLSTQNDRSLYSHHKGPRGEFYGVKFDSYVDLQLASALVAEYTNIAFYCRVNNASENKPDLTVYSVKMWSDKGESDELVLYPRSETRYVQDNEGTRIPNGGVSQTGKPYGELYNIRKNAQSIWRMALPRIKEEGLENEVGTGNFSTFSDRMVGGQAIIRIKINNNSNLRYVLEDITIIGRGTWA
jgi:hypothetical protein